LAAETLAELLRMFRTSAGLTQAALAEKAGLSEQAISMLERGSRRRPRIDTVRSLVEALELAPDDGYRLARAARGARRQPPTPPDTPSSIPMIPRQLPPTLSDFTGRGAELKSLMELLSSTARTGTVRMAAVTGMGGVGKTSLAVHAAQLATDAYPDGHLYLDLRGYGPGDPVEPSEALSQLLRSLGIDGQSIPAGLDEAAALYRSRLAGLRVLVLLDNANGAAQVRPLLPGAPGSAVIVTSRRGLTALPGFRHVILAPLPESDSVELLGRIAGADRISTESDTAHAIAQLTGNLPLAVRLIGGRLAARPAWPLTHVVDQLKDEQRRLDELGPDDSGVRANIAGSVRFLAGSGQDLDQQAAAALDLLGLPNSAYLTTFTTAHLLGRSEVLTERMLERLVDVNLLESLGPGRYRLHDLIRAYVRERAEEALSEGTRIDALTRVFRLYTAIAWQCHQLTHSESRRLALATDSLEMAPEFTDAASALRWLDEERTNMREVFQQASRSAALRHLVPQLAIALFGYHESRGRWTDMRAINTTAREIAGALGFDRLAAWLEHDLAIPDAERGQLEQALNHLRSSFAMFAAIDEVAGQVRCCTSLSHILELLGQLDEAVSWGERALKLSQEIEDHTVEGISYLALGNLYNRRGDYVRAERSFNRSIALALVSDNVRSLAKRYQIAGQSYRAAAQYQQAIDSLTMSIEVYGRIPDGNGQSESHRDLAAIHLATGDLTTATSYAETGLRLARTYGNTQREGEILTRLGEIAHAAGDLPRAQSLWRQAAALLHSVSSHDESIALALLNGEGDKSDSGHQGRQ
jgi:tetratricopeptide (TPR) repeat protein/transcriptional regulator with XRE-family HTH domain